jgi:hypothetical protein
MMRLEKVSVSVEPDWLEGGTWCLRVRVRAGGQNFEYARWLPADHFESLFDHCLGFAAEEVKSQVKKIQAGKQAEAVVPGPGNAQPVFEQSVLDRAREIGIPYDANPLPGPGNAPKAEESRPIKFREFF